MLADVGRKDFEEVLLMSAYEAAFSEWSTIEGDEWEPTVVDGIVAE